MEEEYSVQRQRCRSSHWSRIGHGTDRLNRDFDGEWSGIPRRPRVGVYRKYLIMSLHQIIAQEKGPGSRRSTTPGLSQTSYLDPVRLQSSVRQRLCRCGRRKKSIQNDARHTFDTGRSDPQATFSYANHLRLVRCSRSRSTNGSPPVHHSPSPSGAHMRPSCVRGGSVQLTSGKRAAPEVCSFEYTNTPTVRPHSSIRELSLVSMGMVWVSVDLGIMPPGTTT